MARANAKAVKEAGLHFLQFYAGKTPGPSLSEFVGHFTRHHRISTATIKNWLNINTAGQVIVRHGEIQVVAGADLTTKKPSFRTKRKPNNLPTVRQAHRNHGTGPGRGLYNEIKRG